MALTQLRCSRRLYDELVHAHPVSTGLRGMEVVCAVGGIVVSQAVCFAKYHLEFLVTCGLAYDHLMSVVLVTRLPEVRGHIHPHGPKRP